MTLVQKKTALGWAVSILPVRRGTNPAARIVLAKNIAKMISEARETVAGIAGRPGDAQQVYRASIR
jgi:hypothetical protein